MKHSIIALAFACGLCGSAFGAVSLADPEFVLEGDSLISTQVFDDYKVTMSMLLDATTLEKAIGSTTQEMDIASFNMGGTAFTLRFNGGNIKAYKSADATKFWTLLAIDEGNIWANVEKAALTFVFDSSTGTVGTYTTLTLTDAAGTVLYERNEPNSGFKATGGTLKDISIPDSDLVEKAYVMNGISTVEETKKLNKELVPEPTTTTLSLLALAGMLVRRRRH